MKSYLKQLSLYFMVIALIQLGGVTELRWCRLIFSVLGGLCFGFLFEVREKYQ